MKKLVIMFICFILVIGCSEEKALEKDIKQDNIEVDVQEVINEITFAAVGDNLIHGAVYYGARDNNGGYDFTRYYEHTNKITSTVDLAYVNQETPFAGTSYGIQSYPAFNGPVEILDGLNSAGFDWINLASNHTLDVGIAAIDYELEYAEKFPELTISGAFATKEDRDTPQVIEKNGIKIGVLSYTYGLNGFVLPTGMEYKIGLIDYEIIEQEVKRLNEVSDVQIVSLHWGVEYSFTASNEQKELASFLNELGVEVILGAHPHVIQPVETLVNENGEETLVIYSMGNFLSAQDVSSRMLGLMPTFTIEYNQTKDIVAIKDIVLYPTVTYIGPGLYDYRTYLLSDYTNQIANTHYLYTNGKQDTSREYYINIVNEVLDDNKYIIKY